MRATRGIRIFAIVLLLSSLLPFGIAVTSYVQTQSFIENSIAVSAEVVGFVETESTDGLTLYAAQYLFKDTKGLEIKAVSKHSSSSPSVSIGDVVDILYNKKQPDQVRTKEVMSLWGSVIFSLAFGIIDLVIGAFLFLFAPALAAVLNRKYFQSPQDATVKQADSLKL